MTLYQFGIKFVIKLIVKFGDKLIIKPRDQPETKLWIKSGIKLGIILKMYNITSLWCWPEIDRNKLKRIDRTYFKGRVEPTTNIWVFIGGQIVTVTVHSIYASYRDGL